jgi:signal transduction histidine kinase
MLDLFGFSVFPGALISLGIITWESFYELYLQRKRREQLSNLLLRKQQEIERYFVLGQEAERRRLGRELHDHLAALLLNARMMMPSNLEDQVKWNSKDWEGYKRGLISLDQGLNEVRALTYQMDPQPMNVPALKEELNRLLKNLNITRPSCAFHLDFDIDHINLDSSIALDLYRIIQECLSNILKHSAATSVYVELTQKDDRIQLCVTDNGVGFELAKSSGGIGLKSIRNRLNRMKNHVVRIESALGDGTSVYVSFTNDAGEVSLVGPRNLG